MPYVEVSTADDGSELYRVVGEKPTKTKSAGNVGVAFGLIAKVAVLTHLIAAAGVGWYLLQPIGIATDAGLWDGRADTVISAVSERLDAGHPGKTIGILAWTVSVMLLAAWMYVGHRSVRDSEHVQLGSTWAVLGWLIPGVNLIQPHRVAQEMHVGASDERRPTPGNYITLWWQALIFAVVLGTGPLIAGLVAGRPSITPELAVDFVRYGLFAHIAAGALLVIHLLLGIGVLTILTARLRAHHRSRTPAAAE